MKPPGPEANCAGINQTEGRPSAKAEFVHGSAEALIIASAGVAGAETASGALAGVSLSASREDFHRCGRDGALQAMGAVTRELLVCSSNHGGHWASMEQ